MTSVTAERKCSACGRPSTGGLFCSYSDCGAYLEWSEVPSEPAAGEKHDGAAEWSAGDGRTDETEWPPGKEYEPDLPVPEPEPAETPAPARENNPIREWFAKRQSALESEKRAGDSSPQQLPQSVLCRFCQTENSPRILFCRTCERSLAEPEMVAPSRIQRVLRRAKGRVPAGEPIAPPRPVLRVLVVSLLVLALLLGAFVAWGSIRPRQKALIEALFPKFITVQPTSERYVSGRTNPRHNVQSAFDRDINTYWQSTTPRFRADRIVVAFDSPVNVDEVIILAGDPTGTDIVPRHVQMTFYKPKPFGSADRAPGDPSAAWPIHEPIENFSLANTEAEQRFATNQEGIARIVITIRGVYGKANPDPLSKHRPRLKAALTEVEFKDKVPCTVKEIVTLKCLRAKG